jgi:hypothetical protein
MSKFLSLRVLGLAAAIPFAASALVACSGSDSSVVADQDTGASNDASPDSTSIDTAVDTATPDDTGIDSTVPDDTSPDTMIDATPDTLSDGAVDTMIDATPDATPDAVSDAAPDAVSDAVSDAVVDAVADAAPDAIPDAVADSATDAAGDTAMCALTVCGTACVDTKTDVANCGVCGHACSAGAACLAGSCGVLLPALGGPITETAAFGNPAGGASSVESCPAPQVLTAINVQTNGYLRHVQGVCSKLVLNADGTLSTTPGMTLPDHGGAISGTAGSTSCPANQVMVGFTGRSGLLVDQLAIRCAAVKATGTGPYTATFGAIATATPAGGTGGAAGANVDCPAGQVASIIHMSNGDGVDSFRVQCRPLSIFGVTRGAVTSTSLVGNASGGTSFVDVCPDGQVFSGLDVQVSSYVVRAAARCRPLSPLDLFGPWSILQGPSTAMTMHGTLTGTAATGECALGSMATGFTGRAGLLVDNVQLACAASGTAGSGSFTLGAASTSPALGGAGGAAFMPVACPAGAVAIGANIRAGNGVDAFGLVCAPEVVK